MREQLGKIERASFGAGGYQDAMIGFSFTLSGEAWGVSDFWGAWSYRPEGAEWSEESRVRRLGEATLRAAKLLEDAKVQRFDQLVGVPVMVAFNGQSLSSWRILERGALMSNANQPAFPTPASEYRGEYYGLTKREHFAALVLAELAEVSNPEYECMYTGDNADVEVKKAATMAVRYADAILIALEDQR